MARSGSAHHAAHVYSTLSKRDVVAQSAVAASWSRSMVRYGLDPDLKTPPKRLSQSEFDLAMERIGALVSLAQTPLDKLFQSVGDAGCCVLLTDGEGVPLDRRSAAGDDAEFAQMGLWTGMVWSEASEGTNGVGTCLAEGRALTIHRDQHFLTRNIGLSCSVAPIWDAQGRLIAALDVSTCRSDLTPGMLKLIANATIEAAQRIEAHHFRMAYPKARIILAQDAEGTPAGLLAVDKEDLVIGASRAARLAYGLTDERLARRIPADDILGGEDGGTDRALNAAERGAVSRAMARAEGNVSAAARLLGISRATMHRKLSRLDIEHRS